MTSGKTVWIIDRQQSVYLDAIPVLAARGVDLQVIDPLGPRPVDTSAGYPELIVTAQDYLPAWLQLTCHLDPVPETWEICQNGDGLPTEPGGAMIPGAQQVPLFTSATDLVERLIPLPPRLALATVPRARGSSQYVVSLADRQAVLTAREFAIIRILTQASGALVSRQDIFRQVWSGAKVCAKTLDVHISKLRRKLLPLGVGIEFRAPASYALVHK
jgi:hypothetical protein